MRRHFSRPRDRSTPMPCHVLNCECPRFLGEAQSFFCPVCQREYATRASLEIHLYGQHPGLSARERSVLLQAAMNGRPVLVRLPSESRGGARPAPPSESAEV